MKFFTNLVAFAASTVLSLAQIWHTNPANGHKYAEILGFSHWTGAEANAVLLGGHLVTINDAAENEWVRTTFELSGGIGQWCWIGLYESDFSLRTWSWISGEAVNYTNWGSGEPSSAAEHWAAMDGDGWWRDLAGDWPAPMRHIAVVEVTVVPEPTTIAAFGIGLLATIKRRRK